jgi:hypothetical protein
VFVKSPRRREEMLSLVMYEFGRSDVGSGRPSSAFRTSAEVMKGSILDERI